MCSPFEIHTEVSNLVTGELVEGTFKGGEIKASCVKSEGDNGTDITGLH